MTEIAQFNKKISGPSGGGPPVGTKVPAYTDADGNVQVGIAYVGASSVPDASKSALPVTDMPLRQLAETAVLLLADIRSLLMMQVEGNSRPFTNVAPDIQ